MSSAHIDQIFRSHDRASESVGKGSGHLQKSSERQGKKEGRGGWGKEKNLGGVGGEGQKKSAEGGVGWVDDDVIKK